jgi:hypothetical protein
VSASEQIKLSVELEYGHLAEGERCNSQICPACKGGSSQEASFNVERRDGLLRFKCHRASCPVSGVAGGTATLGDASSKPTSPRRVPYIPLSPLPAGLAKFLAEKYNLTAAALERADLGWTGDGTTVYARRVAYPILRPDHCQRGTQYRTFNRNRDLKAITRLVTEDEIALAWYKWQRRSDYLILVEDPLSPLKLAETYHCAALLGTNLSEAKLDEIIEENKKEKYKAIYLCLDNDATYEAIKQMLKCQPRLPNLKVLGLPKDIKNMNTNELEEFKERLK